MYVSVIYLHDSDWCEYVGYRYIYIEREIVKRIIDGVCDFRCDEPETVPQCHMCD